MTPQWCHRESKNGQLYCDFVTSVITAEALSTAAISNRLCVPSRLSASAVKHRDEVAITRKFHQQALGTIELKESLPNTLRRYHHHRYLYILQKLIKTHPFIIIEIFNNGIPHYN